MWRRSQGFLPNLFSLLANSHGGVTMSNTVSNYVDHVTRTLHDFREVEAMKAADSIHSHEWRSHL